MGVVAGGAADVADEPAEDGAGHRPPVVSLQVVRAGEERVKEIALKMRLSFGRSLKTNLNRKQKIEIGNTSYRNCEGSDLKTSSPSPFLWQSTQCLISLPFILTILASR